ncbi:MAG TPA: M48 family metallopeptidase [Gemmataceae bacterium]|nr:M48 family metallopeptidase [Gemmataceae bacterium]
MVAPLGPRHKPAPAPAARRWTVVLLAFVAGLLLSCGNAPDFNEGGGQGPGRRPQQLGLSPKQEMALGDRAYAEIMSKAKAKGILLPDDSSETERVRQVGQRIEKAVAIEPLQHEINLRIKGYRFDWKYHVLRAKEINAFCLPGGRVFVFTGLLPVVQNDDQLATVMGHEIAHALAHHASERVAREDLDGTARLALQMQMSSMDPDTLGRLMGALAPGWAQLNYAGTDLGTLAFDRAQESEADHIGVFLMTFAGYDPQQAVVFWKRMMEANRGGQPPEILSDHPSDTRRIRQLEEWVPEAKGAKKAYDQGHIAPTSGQ